VAADESALPDRLTLTAFAAVTLMGGTNFVAVKFTVRDLDPFWGAGSRFLVSAALLFLIVAVRRLPLPRGGALVGAVLYGILSFTAFYAFTYYAIQRLPAGIAATLGATVPLLTLLFAVVQGLETFRLRGLIGALVAVGGIALLAGGAGEGTIHLPSVFAILAGAACGAEAGIVLKRFPGTHPITTNAVAIGIGAVLLLALGAVAGESFALPSRAVTWTAMTYLATLGTVGLFILYVFALNRWTASGMSYIFVLMPVVAVVLSAVLLEERVTFRFGISAALVLAGTYIGALSGHRRKPEAAEPEKELVALQATAAGSQRPPC
jgi:drug/metabolite transporter (DMT)-like permease